jgi:phosphocarrier protein
MTMATTTAIIGSASGLHARPASLFAAAAAETKLAVTLRKGEGKAVNAASILGVLTLGASQGDTVELTVEGDGADAALASLATLLESNLDEA